jgi:hypothetical protein
MSELSPQEARAEQSCAPDTLRAYLHRALLAGQTQHDISRHFHVSRITLGKWLAKRGLKPVRSVHTHTPPTSRR